MELYQDSVLVHPGIPLKGSYFYELMKPPSDFFANHLAHFKRIFGCRAPKGHVTTVASFKIRLFNIFNSQIKE